MDETVSQKLTTILLCGVAVCCLAGIVVLTALHDTVPQALVYVLLTSMGILAPSPATGSALSGLAGAVLGHLINHPAPAVVAAGDGADGLPVADPYPGGDTTDTPLDPVPAVSPDLTYRLATAAGLPITPTATPGSV